MSVITQFITADGVRYTLDAPGMASRVVLQEEAYGMPSIEYITQRGPFQHGETLVDYFLKPRVIQLLIRHKYCSLQDYWDGRADILDILRPNRMPVGVFGKIRKILPSGAKRDLDVYIESGPGFVPHRSGWDEWAYEEALRFIAHNPIWYDPIKHVSLVFDLEAELVFPIDFPIFFSATRVATSVINYSGTWEEYPTIRITGPITDPSITNTTTGEKIALIYSLAAGASIIVTLSYSNKTITRNDGVNLIPYITTDSELTTFHLAPAVPNTIVTLGTNTLPSTTVTVEWYDRYIGV